MIPGRSDEWENNVEIERPRISKTSAIPWRSRTRIVSMASVRKRRVRPARSDRWIEAEKAFQCEAAHTSSPSEDASEQTGAALLFSHKGGRIRSSHPLSPALSPGISPLPGFSFASGQGTDAEVCWRSFCEWPPGKFW
jgi:hypothetical protein